MSGVAAGPGEISGRIVLDVDSNEQVDLTDTPQNGVTVELRRSYQAIKTTVTDAEGNFSFDGLEVGDKY